MGTGRQNKAGDILNYGDSLKLCKDDIIKYGDCMKLCKDENFKYGDT